MSDAKDTLESPKFANELDQISEDTDYAITSARRLLSGNKLKLCSSTAIRRFKKSILVAEKTYDAMEQERGKIIFDGKEGTKYFEQLLSSHIVALDNLEKELALYDALVGAALGFALNAFFTGYGEYVGYGKKFNAAVADLFKILKALEAAMKAEDAAKVKMMFGSVIAAIAILIPPVSVAGALTVAAVSVSTDLAIDYFLEGSGSSKLENSWKLTDATASTAQNVVKSSSKVWSVFGAFIGTGFDGLETVETMQSKAAIDKKLKDFMKTYRKPFDDYKKFTSGMRSAGKIAVAKFKDASYASNAFRSKKAPRMQVVRGLK